MPTADEWAEIRTARAMQNEPNSWDQPCRCGHAMREHRLTPEDDMDMGGYEPDCMARRVEFNPYSRTNVEVICTCMRYAPRV